MFVFVYHLDDGLFMLDSFFLKREKMKKLSFDFFDLAK
jgi:hypothetical protein